MLLKHKPLLEEWQTVYTLKEQNIGMRDVTSFHVPLYNNIEYSDNSISDNSSQVTVFRGPTAENDSMKTFHSRRLMSTLLSNSL